MPSLKSTIPQWKRSCRSGRTLQWLVSPASQNSGSTSPSSRSIPRFTGTHCDRVVSRIAYRALALFWLNTDSRCYRSKADDDAHRSTLKQNDEEDHDRCRGASDKERRPDELKRERGADRISLTKTGFTKLSSSRNTFHQVR